LKQEDAKEEVGLDDVREEGIVKELLGDSTRFVLPVDHLSSDRSLVGE